VGCIPSVSSLSFEAREQRFGKQTPYLDATKQLEGIFEILSGV